MRYQNNIFRKNALSGWRFGSWRGSWGDADDADLRGSVRVLQVVEYKSLDGEIGLG
jgi:hypothetical protein